MTLLLLGPVSERFMVHVLHSGYKLCLVLRSSRDANKGRDTEWMSVIAHCAHIPANLAVVNAQHPRYPESLCSLVWLQTP